MNRGFALEIEENYGEDIEPNEFNPAWFQDVDSADFKLNDDIITKSGGSRMDQVARPGVLKPSGSISADVDLQRIIYYFFGLLDNYKCTDNNDGTYIHEFWGGEGKDLKSFRPPILGFLQMNETSNNTTLSSCNLSEMKDISLSIFSILV